MRTIKAVRTEKTIHVADWNFSQWTLELENNRPETWNCKEMGNGFYFKNVYDFINSMYGSPMICSKTEAKGVFENYRVDFQNENKPKTRR
jgi:hypothetical protein